MPYKGAGPAMTDVIGRQIEMTFVSTVFVQPFIKSGRVRALALTGGERAPVLPDVPTFKELGYSSIVGETWFAVFAPAGTPQPVLDKLSSSITRVVNTPDFAKRMEAIGNVPWAMTPAELGAHVVSERERLGKLIRDANITVE